MFGRIAIMWTVAALGFLAGCSGHRVSEAGLTADADTRRDDRVADAMRFIEPFEGRRHGVYEDSTGHATIGVGFNLDRPGAAQDIARLLPGVSYRALRRGEQRLTDQQIDTLLRHDVQRAIEVALRHVPNLNELPYDAQLVLIDMTFNLGSLAAWRDLRAAVAAADFDAAAAAMHDSRWRSQTGQRAMHLISIMDSLG